MSSTKVYGFIFSLLPIFLFGQEYKGVIKNKKTNEGLSYVNIGIPAKAWGFLSDENGNFTFKATSEKDNDTIQFSLIGYQTVFMPIRELKTKCESGNSIYLHETAYELAPVTITSTEYVTTVMGRKNLEDLECIEIARPTDTTYNCIAREKGLDTNSIGLEFGNKISIKEGQRTFIDKVQFKVCLDPKDTAIYRINIYTKGKVTGRQVTPCGVIREETLINVMKEPVVLKCTGKTEVKTIDLSSQNIEVNDDFIVALECIYASTKKNENRGWLVNL